MIRVLIADDHGVVRDGLRVLLDAQADICVIGDATNGRSAVDAARRLRPDVAVLDIAMPELNGIEATLQIRAASPHTKVLILSMHSTAEHVFRALRAGAHGYLLKDSAGREVVGAVRAVHAARPYLSDSITAIVIDDYISERSHLTSLDRLSHRERQILQLVAEGKSSATAGAILSLSPKTVDTYRSRIMHKLEVSDLASLVKFALQHGVTRLD